MIQRGVWYRLEHELTMNTNYNSSANQLSGTSSKIWLYRKSDEVLLRAYGIKDTFPFDANRDGKNEIYPLMPRVNATQKINGIFMSIQQGGSLSGSGPWALDYVIAMRDFGLYLK